MASEDPRLIQPLDELVSQTASLLQESARKPFEEYDYLAQGNSARAQEYSRVADVTSGITVFVEQLHTKNEQLRVMLGEVDEVDAQLCELEAVVATLDSFTAGLEARIAAMPNSHRNQQAPVQEP